MLFRPEMVASVALALSTYLAPTVAIPIDIRDELEIHADLEGRDNFKAFNDLDERDTTNSDTCDSSPKTTGDQVAVWFGQRSGTSLKAVCADPAYNIVAISFVTYLNWQETGFPAMNLGPYGWATTAAQKAAGATGLLDTSNLAVDVLACQAAGKKVLMSLGGDTRYSNVLFPSAAAAQDAATVLWKLFLGGSGYSTIRPFGPNVVLDGFDLDNEGINADYYAEFINALRAYFSTDLKHKYYLSGAPQCPFPDVSLTSADIKMLDFVFVTFYNNPVCNANGSGFKASLAQWSTLLTGTNAELFIGLPADSPAAGSGYVTPVELKALLQTAKTTTPNLGGVVLWDAAFAVGNSNYQTTVKAALNA